MIHTNGDGNKSDDIPFALDKAGKPIIYPEWKEWHAEFHRDKRCPCHSGFVTGHCHECAFGREQCPEHAPGQPPCPLCTRREQAEKIAEVREGLREFITDVLAEELPDAVFAILRTRRVSA